MHNFIKDEHLFALEEDYGSMQWIFITSKKHNLNELDSSYITHNGQRLFYFGNNVKTNLNNSGEFDFFAGELLEETLSKTSVELLPEHNYYGVYTHGRITEENCFFASDELGLSPIYYSSKGDYLFIASNPHLIVKYKLALGFKIFAEPTLPVWHMKAIAVESDKTGYQDIYRLRPWKYIMVDQQNNMNFPSKKRTHLPESYDDCIDLCIKELRQGMKNIQKGKKTFTSQITGGFDSRLTLGFVLDGKYEEKFEYSTLGLETNPDVIIGKELAKKFKLNWKHNNNPIDINQEMSLEAVEKEVDFRAIAYAMETGTIRYPYFFLDLSRRGSKNLELNGKGSVFAKSYRHGVAVETFMKKRFKDVDFNNLSPEEKAYLPQVFGHAKSYRSLMTQKAFNVSMDNRKYIIDFGMSRFPENMLYIDTLPAYKSRNHHANLVDNESIFLYSPVVLETARRLTPLLRYNAKLYFDIMYKLNPELCYIPFENRVVEPEIYKEYPAIEKEKIAAIPACEGSITIEYNVRLFDYLLPHLRKKLIKMLPKSVFQYVDKNDLKKRLRENELFDVKAYPLINLYGIARWHMLIEKLNKNPELIDDFLELDKLIQNKGK